MKYAKIGDIFLHRRSQETTPNGVDPNNILNDPNILANNKETWLTTLENYNNANYMSTNYHINLQNPNCGQMFIGCNERTYNYTRQYSSMTEYELTNHLGNVLATIKDEKKQVSLNGTTVDYYEPIVMTATDYYPFGMPMPNRTYSLSSGSKYRFGFNGVEKESDIYGEGNAYEFKYRMHDSRIGRFLSVDPLKSQYPFYTPYQFAGNNPIQFIDLEGLEPALPRSPSIDEAALKVENSVKLIIDLPSKTIDYFKTKVQEVTKYDPPRQNGTVVVDHTSAAVNHYYRGNGEPVQIGPKTQEELKNSEDMGYYQNRIESGQTPAPASGLVKVNMTTESARSYHLGRIPVNYVTKCNSTVCLTTYTVEGDGFYDIFWGEDKKGTKGELGGTPYNYNSFSWTVPFANPGYKTDNGGTPQPIIEKVTKGEGAPNSTNYSSSSTPLSY